MSPSGLVNMALVCILTALGYWILLAILGLYIIWCIQDSADGGTRAPENLSLGWNVIDVLRIWVLVLLIILIFYAIPLFLTFTLTGYPRVGPLVLAAISIACLPMILLSMVLFGPISGLNPRYWLSAIAGAFVPYLGLLTCLAVIVGAMFLTFWTFRGLNLLALWPIPFCYLSLIAAHILGRLYFIHKDRIGWGI